MRLDRVSRDTDENRSRLFEVSGPLTELLRFDRSARGVVHRIGPKNDVLLPAEVDKPQVTRLRVAFDGGQLFPDLNVGAHGSTRCT